VLLANGVGEDGEQFFGQDRLAELDARRDGGEDR
jgi:hypothetical protein